FFRFPAPQNDRNTLSATQKSGNGSASELRIKLRPAGEQVVGNALILIAAQRRDGSHLKGLRLLSAEQQLKEIARTGNGVRTDRTQLERRNPQRVGSVLIHDEVLRLIIESAESVLGIDQRERTARAQQAFTASGEHQI